MNATKGTDAVVWNDKTAGGLPWTCRTAGGLSWT